MQDMRMIRMFGAAIGRGAADEGCALGAHALRRAGIRQRLLQGGRAAKWETTIVARRNGSELAAVRQFSRELARPVCAAVQRNQLPLVLGGDHSCAIGTWSGVASALRPRGALGLVWIDAHMDAHLPHTSPTGNLHGMPLACLLGHGDGVLAHLAGAPALRPEHVCLVGVRSFEDGEAELLERLRVRVIAMDEVHRRGLADCLAEATHIASEGTAAYGLTLDIDGLDPIDAPGVGTPVPGGIRGGELRDVLSARAGDARLAALEVVEYNPLHDPAGVTARLALDLTVAALGASEPLSDQRPQPNGIAA